MTALFVFGTLRDPELLEIVAGRPVTVRPASLPDHEVWRVAGEDFPVCIAHPGGAADGLILDGLGARELERFDFYELGFGYRREEHGISVARDRLPAQVYMPAEGRLAPSDEPWSLAHWQQAHGALTRETAREAMALLGRIPAADLPGRWPVLAARAQSRLAARARPAPSRPDLPDLSRLETRRVDVVHDGFFRLEDHLMRYPTFDGGLSAPVSRIAFVSVDAVTVLPYDPARDRVLLVDQFRIGPHARGDLQPWTLEAIAGRVDGGETWEATAMREAREEAGLELRGLERIASYYPSPGAMTEYIASYLGFCDLPDDRLGDFGMPGEHEDIRTRLVSFAALMEMTRDGRVQNAPLMISALWLAAHRDRLRAAV